MNHQYDVVIIGAGLAGLRAAIELGEDTRSADWIDIHCNSSCPSNICSGFSKMNGCET